MKQVFSRKNNNLSRRSCIKINQTNQPTTDANSEGKTGANQGNRG